MPVPVPYYIKEPAHPVIKPNQPIGRDYEPSIFQHLTQPPLPPTGPPPSFASREEWISSLPSWRRNKPRRIWEEDVAQLQAFAPQDFDGGLTAAANAPVSKGPLAQACIPPIATLVASAGLEPSPLTNMYPREQDVDLYLPPVRGWQCRDDSGYQRVPPARYEQYGELSPESDVDSVMEVIHYEAELVRPRGGYQTCATGECYGSQEYERGAFSPVLEDLSPEPADMQDPVSSPMGPATPFADYVDRAVAAAQVSAYDTLVSSHARQEAPYGYHDDYCAAPCYECQSYQPVAEQAPAQAAEAVVTPTATVAYRKLAEPLSEWVASFVWKVCTTGMKLQDEAHQPRAFLTQFSSVPHGQLASSTHTMLLSTLLQPSAVYLALWYIVRLPVFFGPAGLTAQHVKENRFVSELLGEPYMQHDREVLETYAPFRLVILGCMLANKWLDDHTFSNKTWHTISNIPIQSLNRLESLALELFEHDLSISPENWSAWLADLLSYHVSLTPTTCQPISRPSANPHTIIRNSIETLAQIRVAAVRCSCDDASCYSVVPAPVFVGLEGKKGDRMEAELYDVDALEIDLDEDGPLREEYLPRRRVSAAGSGRRPQVREGSRQSDRSLPPPAKWSPSADEPIYRDVARLQGQYVAVQPVAHMALPPPPAPPLPFHQVLDQRHAWPLPSYLPKQEHVAPYGPVPFPVHPQYVSYDYGQAPQAHQRSHSLSYNPAINGYTQARPRAYSQTRYEQAYPDVRYAEHSYAPPPVPAAGWNAYDRCRYNVYCDRPFDYLHRYPMKV